MQFCWCLWNLRKSCMEISEKPNHNHGCTTSERSFRCWIELNCGSQTRYRQYFDTTRAPLSFVLPFHSVGGWEDLFIKSLDISSNPHKFLGHDLQQRARRSVHHAFVTTGKACVYFVLLFSVACCFLHAGTRSITAARQEMVMSAINFLKSTLTHQM